MQVSQAFLSIIHFEVLRLISKHSYCHSASAFSISFVICFIRSSGVNIFANLVISKLGAGDLILLSEIRSIEHSSAFRLGVFEGEAELLLIPLSLSDCSFTFGVRPGPTFFGCSKM